MSGSILELTAVVKNYGGLRPLRIEQFALAAGEQTAIVGLDGPGAEVFINLVTGATLPEQGTVRAFGRATSEIADADAWLAAADRFGIFSERAVMLDSLTVVQNLSMSFSLEIEPPGPDIERQAHALADDVGLALDDRARRVADVGPLARARVRLARALAFNPEILLLEHPSAGIARNELSALARQVRDLAASRRFASVTLTADAEFAADVASRVLSLEPGTGRLREARRRRWFSLRR
ncbi:MAG: ATP-binding cassette domain-containing protein [Vicinamibacterales bacterium]